MKVTLKAINRVMPESAPLSAYKSSCARAKNKPRTTSNQTACTVERGVNPWRMPHRCSTGSLGNTLFGGFTPGFTRGRQMQSSTGAKKISSQKNNTYPFNLITPSAMDRVSSTHVPTANPTSVYSSPPQTWFFSFAARELRNSTTRIQLTAIESLLIKTLTLSVERICSKQELILGIDKDPQTYSGLEMCLSRLQSKFKDTFSERLFRSVRNRGYCLVQDVKIIQ